MKQTFLLDYNFSAFGKILNRAGGWDKNIYRQTRSSFPQKPIIVHVHVTFLTKSRKYATERRIPIDGF